jgi:hypothetical protein
MAYRDVIVEVTVKLKMKIDEGTEVGDVVSELDYHFADQTGNATVEDTEITDHEVKDSK